MSTLFDHPVGSSEPAWMRAYTTRTGAPPHLGTGKARPHRCPTCGRWTLQGLDSNLCALLATVDPNPLTPQTEAAAIILGRPTYTLHGAPGRYELWHRTPHSARHLTPAHGRPGNASGPRPDATTTARPSTPRRALATLAAGLRWEGVRRFGADYARTLSEWSRRFEAASAEVSRLGFDERFQRLWRFYLAYCEAGFSTARTDVIQCALRRT